MVDGSNRGSEWVYKPIFNLPFGWKIVRLKRKFSHLSWKYKSPILYRKIELGTCHYREEYWPETYIKCYRKPNDHA